MTPLAELVTAAQQHQQRKNWPQAEQCYHQLAQANPHNAEFWFRLADACRAQGKLPEATAGYQQVLRLMPGHVEALVCLAVALAEQQRLEEAIAHFQQALRLRPDFAQAHHNLGVALAQQGRLEESAASIRQALQLKPDYAEAHYNLGNTLSSMNRRDEAAASYRHAIRLKPGYAEAYNNLGLALTEMGQPTAAEVFLKQAARLQPDNALAHNNLGLALADQGKLAEAVASYETALRLRPDYAEVHCNLAGVFKDQGNLAASLASYQVALWLNPDDASTRWNRALALLQHGDFADGWAEYEWRWKRKQARPRPFREPAWDGSPLAGRTILLWMEQGFGDMLHYIRYARLVRERGGRVVVEAPASLLPLFSTCPGIERLVAEGAELGAFDVQAPLLSLPFLCRTTLETIPADVPYLAVDAERVERWRQRLADIPDFRVGIAWQGNPKYKADRFRSMPLRRFEVLSRLSGVSLVSLQKGPGTEQVAGVRRRFRVHELGEIDEAGGAFLDTAAVMKNLDLVISADTATAHLAGALGVPVWVALASAADSRWLLDRDDSPWYPTARLFRQRQLGDWTPVFEQMAKELKAIAAARPVTAQVEIAPGELLDKIAILQIKAAKMDDSDKLAHVRRELAALEAVREQLASPTGLGQLTAELQAVNEALWEVEDEIRRCEQRQDFGSRFVELARSVYRENDRRALLKRRINEVLGARFAEQKSYSAELTNHAVAACRPGLHSP